MDPTLWDDIDRIAVESAQALFVAHGTRLRAVEPGAATSGLRRVTLTAIAFGGSQLRGTLVLCADTAALEHSHPARSRGDTPRDEDLRDWSAELTNQLLGRIKNRLLTHGVVLEPEAPTTVSGLDVRVGESLRNTHCVPHEFELAGARIQLRFEAVAEPGLRFRTAPPGEGVITPEGKLLLF